MRVVQPLVIEYLVTSGGQCPVKDWLWRLSPEEQLRVDRRLARVEQGSLGDFRSLGGGLNELKFASGPGYRIYFGWLSAARLILIYAGDKGSQARDIARARHLWRDFATDDSGDV